MGFWIFVTICNFLIPLMMAVFGKIFEKNPPASINGVYGYRTSMSRKNQDTWDFAHFYCGRLWWRTGLIMFPATIIAMLPVIKKGEHTIGMWGVAVEIFQSIVMLGTIILVERALRKNFDKAGNRKNKQNN